jgi:hypothetical protein
MDENDAGQREKVCPACKESVRWETLKEANYGSEGGYEHHRVAYCKTGGCRKEGRPVAEINAPM